MARPNTKAIGICTKAYQSMVIYYAGYHEWEMLLSRYSHYFLKIGKIGVQEETHSGPLSRASEVKQTVRACIYYSLPPADRLPAKRFPSQLAHASADVVARAPSARPTIACFYFAWCAHIIVETVSAHCIDIYSGDKISGHTRHRVRICPT